MLPAASKGLVSIVTEGRRDPDARSPVDMIGSVALLLLLFALASRSPAQTGENILLVANRNDPVSLQIADYYRPRRSVPVSNVCYLATTSQEEIQWKIYENEIERPIADCLQKAGLL